MKLSIRIFAVVMLAVGLSASTARGAYILSALNVAVTEDFHDYSGGGAPNINWTLAGVTGPLFLNQNNGSSDAGGFYSYGTTGSQNRALGYLGNSTDAQSITNVAMFQNATGVVVSELAIAFDAQQWRGQFDERIGGWQLGISTDGGMSYDPINAGNLSTWLASNQLPTGPVNGHTHSSTRSGTVTGLSIANGASFRLRWSSNEGTGAPGDWSQGIAIDNISVSAVPEPSVSVLAVFAAIAVFGIARRSRRA